MQPRTQAFGVRSAFFRTACSARFLPAVFHAAAPQRAQELKSKILERVPQAEIRIEPVGPVIGIYTGTGCAGISFTEKEDL